MDNTTITPDFEDSRRDFSYKQMLHDVVAVIACLQYHDPEKTKDAAIKLFEGAKALEELIKSNPPKTQWAQIPTNTFANHFTNLFCAN